MEWWDLCCSDHKYVAIAAPRGFAKSTSITHAFTLAKLLFRESMFIIIISDTEYQSSLFLNAIKTELMENEALRAMFGVDSLTKDTETDVIVRFNDGHEVRLIAKGSEQKLRGLKWGSKRPDLVICDDLENDELVMNDDRRKKFKKWFMSAVVPILSDSGVIRVVGTILHADSLLEGFMPKLRDQYTVVTPLKEYATKYRGWVGVKYKAHDGTLPETAKHFLWEAKQDREKLTRLRESYVDQGTPEIYAQEYLNNPIDDSMRHFKKSDLIDLTADDKEKKLNYYITMDLAVTLKQSADWSVFIVWGVDDQGIVHVRHIIRQRMDSLEIVDTIFSLVKMYDPSLVVTEKGIIANSILPAIVRRMSEDDVYFQFELLPSTVDKLQRSQAIRLRARAGKVKIDKRADWYGDFEEELLQFPRGLKDDQVDAFSLIGHVLNKFWEAPTPKEEEDMEYERELEESGNLFMGRNNLTGY
jgi:predicted phage terminase large subunit-like protein